jgi:hypothetical protein
MRKMLIAIWLMLFLPVEISAQTWTVSSLEWSRPRSGEMLVENKQLRDLMQHYQQHPNQHITITFPGGDEGILWAEELKGWFVALGVANNRIELVPGSAVADMITLGLKQVKEQLEY